jgi:hemerythrin-like domain-containing protein
MLVAMKRSDALSPLSRQHHHGLAAALKLKRADANTAGDARTAFLEFWETERREHFRLEEEVLLPSYARYGEADHPAVVRVLVEHVDLRRRGADLAATPSADPGVLHDLGERLERHIRHEERVLFPLIEAALPEAELARVARAG